MTQRSLPASSSHRRISSSHYYSRPAVLVCPCMLQHASRSANPSLSFFTMLHAAAGRAFARSSAREYHPTSHTKDAAVVASRRKEKKISGKDDRAAFVHVITRTP